MGARFNNNDYLLNNGYADESYIRTVHESTFQSVKNILKLSHSRGTDKYYELK